MENTSISARNYYALFLIFIVTSITGSLTWAQDTNYDIAVPPSPNAASLGQYGDVPVDKFHGIPSISVPLYTIQVDDITVPISLSFHAGGFKVGTTASWVGLGWSLNAGGAVTRTMRDRPDESGYFQNMNDILDWQQQGIIDWVYNPYTGSDPDIIALKDLMWNMYTHQWDAQADVFFYNFPGGSGKFMFNPDQSLTQFPYQDLRIETYNLSASNNWTLGSLGGFDIYDLNGTQYKFREPEETSLEKDPGDYLDYNGSWYLTNISSQRSSKYVNFSYSNEYTVIGNQITTYSITETADNWNLQSYGVSSSSHVKTPTYKTKYLDSITWEGGSIVFTTSGNRLDLTGARKLDLVEIKDHNGAIVKTLEFTYDYFNTSGYLRLQSITEKGPNGESKPPYTFIYNEGVPATNSLAQDHFGYYNGVPGNLTLVPDYTNLWNALREHADREPGNGTSVCGTLSELHYPTGGYTEFHYEANERRAWGQASVSAAANAEKCDANGLLYYDSDGNPVIGLFCEETDSDLLTIPAGSTCTVDIDFFFDPVSPPSSGGGNIMEVNIYEINGTSETFVPPSYSFSGLSSESHPITLTGGKTYRIESVTNVQGTRVSGILTASYFQDQNEHTSGVRIKKIVHHDENNDIVREIRYDYNLYSDPTKSSGKYIAHPLNYRTTYSNSPLMKVYAVHHASPKGVLGALDGDFLVYEEVFEYEIGNGGVRSYFNSDIDDFLPQGSSSPSEGGFNSNFWKRGTLEREEIFNENGDKLQTSVYNYTYEPTDTTTTFIYEIYDEFPSDNRAYEYRYTFDQEITGWARLDNAVTTYQDQLANTVTNTYETNSPLILPISVDYDLGGNGLDYSEDITYLNDRTDHVIAPITNRKRFDDQGGLLQETKNFYTNYLLDKTQVLNSSGQVIAETNFSQHNGLKPSYVEPHTGVNTVLVWGYNNTVPIAQVVNATYTEVMDELPVGFDAGNGGFNGTEEADLRSGLPSDAQVTTYSHQSLVGLLSATDVNELTTTYTYDDLARLTNVKDYEGNILQQYAYHYEDGGGGSGGSNPLLALSANTLSPGASGSTHNVTVTSNLTWTSSENTSWLIVTPGSGTDNGAITIDVIENTDVNSRSGTVTVAGGVLSETISITQDGATPVLTVSPSQLNFQNPGTQSITITAAGSWSSTITYFDGSGWLSRSPSSGSGNATMNVTASQPSGTGPWEADINIISGGVTETVHIVYFGGI